MENRHGLIVDEEPFAVNGTAEHNAALAILEQIPRGNCVTAEADKAHHPESLPVSPYAAQNGGRRSSSVLSTLK